MNGRWGKKPLVADMLVVSLLGVERLTRRRCYSIVFLDGEPEGRQINDYEKTLTLPTLDLLQPFHRSLITKSFVLDITSYSDITLLV